MARLEQNSPADNELFSWPTESNAYLFRKIIRVLLLHAAPVVLTLKVTMFRGLAGESRNYDIA